MMASGVLSGKFDKNTMVKKKDSAGITFEEALKSIGYEGESRESINRGHCFFRIAY